MLYKDPGLLRVSKLPDIEPIDVGLFADLLANAVCCIYHAPHPVGESSDESSSSSDSESSSGDSQSSDDDDGGARMAGNRKAKVNNRGKRVDKHVHEHEHEHEHEEGHEGCESHQPAEKGEKKGKKRAGNAYERTPKAKGGSNTVVEMKP